MDFSESLRTLRNSRNWTQRDLAKESGFTQTAIANWEGGKSTPYPKNVAALAKALGCRPTELLDTPEVRALEAQLAKATSAPPPAIPLASELPEADAPRKISGVLSARYASPPSASQVQAAMARLDRAVSAANQAMAEVNAARLELQTLIEGR